MKSLFVVLAMLFATSSFAAQKVVYVTGYGNSSGYCQAAGSYFCIDQLERRAKDDAYDDADWACYTQKGNLQGSSFSCSAFCSPNYIPPNQSTWVSCRSNCNLPCYIDEEAHQE